MGRRGERKTVGITGRTTGGGPGNEQGACTRRHTEGRVRPRGGRTAQEVERQRSAFRRLGDLPREGVPGGSRTALPVTNPPVDRADQPEGGRPREKLGTTRDPPTATRPSPPTQRQKAGQQTR